MTRTTSHALCALTLSLGLSASSLAYAQNSTVNDPIEPINRGFFQINEMLDTIVFRPVSVVWNAVVPKPVRTGIGNAFANLDDVFIGANHVLQGRGKDAANDFTRVLINTTVGIGGLIDVASSNGIAKGEGDFGQTLGVWGIGEGPYIVLPVLGPSDARDTVGRVARVFSDPRHYMSHVWSYSLFGTEFVEYKADNLDNADLIDSSSLDKYSFTRNLYLQRRAALVNAGRDAVSQH
jgi:phospholipid-binding lipoprotein MlaA